MNSDTDRSIWRFPLIEACRHHSSVVVEQKWLSVRLGIRVGPKLGASMLTVVSMRASITFAAGQTSEIDRYEVPRDESLPGLEIWMTIYDFQIAGIRHDVTELLLLYALFNHPRR